MKNLEDLIKSAVAGDDQAFAEIIRRFQDMAFGYAYTLLSDLYLAEDAVQEAFVEAYYNLKKLKKPDAFPGWLRRIVQFRCNRILDRKRLTQVPLEAAAASASKEPGPYEIMERQDIEQKVFSAINGLSQHLREVTTLFFINGYTKNEIAVFLEKPENTVKSRLKASREQLQRSLNMSDMIKETLNNNKLPEDFARKVIEGVPRIVILSQQTTQKDNEFILLRGTPFPSCLCSCLEKMGEDYGTTQTPRKNPFTKKTINYISNNLYTLLMGVTGAAFRIVWNHKLWDVSTSELMTISNQPFEPIKRAFEAVGYDFQLIGNQDYGNGTYGWEFGKSYPKYDSYDTLRDRIVKSINNSKPVIAWGVYGPPECCIISGYDKSAEILMGWNVFQNSIFGDQKIEFEPSGYYRQRDWFKITPGIILIGKKKEKTPLHDTYKKALKWAVTLTNTEDVYLRKGGLAAYKAWTDSLLNDESFPRDNNDELFNCMLVHNDAMRAVSEGRTYASIFLLNIAETRQEFKGDAEKALEIYSSMMKLLHQCSQLYSSKTFEPDPQKLADPEIRRKMVPVLLQVRDKDAEAIGIIEKILKKW